MLERRKHDRSRDLAAGTIAYGRNRATMDCVVRNLSEGGALLALDEPQRAPVEVILAMRGAVRPARVVWRGDTTVGIAFVGSSGASTAAPLPATVVCLDAVRRERVGGGDEQRLAARIARFVRRPDPSPSRR